MMLRLRQAAALAFLVSALPPQPAASRPLLPRLAIVQVSDSAEERTIHDALRAALAGDTRVQTQESEIVATVLEQARPELSLNMSRLEAIAIGQLIGSEYFLLDRFFAVTRREADGRSWGESLMALFLVDGRNGELVRFDTAREMGATAAEAGRRVIERLNAASKRMVDALAGHEELRMRPKAAQDDMVMEMPAEGGALAKEFVAPQILSRNPPVPTELAEAAEIAATVRLDVQFLSSGRIGEIRSDRWAGYGLDQSAMIAARSLTFRPATLGGQPVSVVAPVEYHFRVAGKRP